MANIGAHIWTIIISIVIFAIALIIWFFAFMNLNNTFASDNLQDAVRTSTYLASDNSSRAEPGTFIINKDKFKKYFNEIHISSLGDHTPGQLDNNGSNYKIYYLSDNPIDEGYGSDDSVYGKDKNGHDMTRGMDHNVSDSYNSRDKRTEAPELNHQNGNDRRYESIRAIRVVISFGHDKNIKNRNLKSDGLTNNDSYTKNHDKFSATDVIQTNNKDANNDPEYDLTR